MRLRGLIVVVMATILCFGAFEGTTGTVRTVLGMHTKKLETLGLYHAKGEKAAIEESCDHPSKKAGIWIGCKFVYDAGWKILMLGGFRTEVQARNFSPEKGASYGMSRVEIERSPDEHCIRMVTGCCDWYCPTRTKTRLPHERI